MLPHIFPTPRNLTYTDGFVSLDGGVLAGAGCEADLDAFLHILRRPDFHRGKGNPKTASTVSAAYWTLWPS